MVNFQTDPNQKMHRINRWFSRFQAATPPGIAVLTSSSSLFRRLRRNKEL